MVLWVCVVWACAERNQTGDLSQGRWVLLEWALKAEEIGVQSRHKEDAYRHQSAEVNQGADLSQGISDIIEYFQLAEGCMVMYSVAVFVHVHTVFGLPWLCLLSGDLQCGYFCPWTHRLSSAFTLPAVWWFTMWLFLSMDTPSLACLYSACCLVIYNVAVFVHVHTVFALPWLCLLSGDLQCGCFCPWTHRRCPALTLLPAVWWFTVWLFLSMDTPSLPCLDPSCYVVICSVAEASQTMTSWWWMERKRTRLSTSTRWTTGGCRPDWPRWAGPLP